MARNYHLGRQGRVVAPAPDQGRMAVTKSGRTARRNRVTVRVGRRDVTKLGARRIALGDAYHLILTLSWARFFAVLIALYLLLNLFFGLAFWAVPGSVANARPGSFADAFFFSIETLATVGYGFMNPGNLYGHAIASVEIFVGMLALALVTGLVFARFSRPTARVMLSRFAVVAPFDGRPTLMVRAANERHNQILEASVRLTLTRDETTLEGEKVRRFHYLDLQRERTPVFALSWTILHTIDDDSPLAGMTRADLVAADAVLVVSISGLDETLVQTVHVRHDYAAEEILFGHRFADILCTDAEGRDYLDLTRFHEVHPLGESGSDAVRR